MAIKIAHITTVHYRHDVRILYKYCLTLANDRDYNVFLMVADGKGPEIIDGLNIVDIGKPILGRVGRFIIGGFKTLKFLRKTKADIIHLHDPELLLVAFIMKIYGRKVIFDMHENLPMEILTKTYIPKILRVGLSKTVKFLQRFVFNYISVIFAEESYIKYFSSVKRKEVIVNFPIVSTLNSISSKKKDDFTLGYMGWVNKERGSLIILNAIKSLRNNKIPVKIVFVGTCAKEVTLTAIYKESIKEGWAEFNDRMKPNDGWLKMSQCHVGLAILQKSPNFIESYPTKLFEYMLLELPVIISDFPLYRSVIEKAECGILINPDSEKEIIKAIKWFMDNPNEAVLMGKRGRKNAIEKYSWDSEYAKLKVFYDKVLE